MSLAVTVSTLGLAVMALAWLINSSWTALVGAVLFLPPALYQAANTASRGVS